MFIREISRRRCGASRRFGIVSCSGWEEAGNAEPCAVLLLADPNANIPDSLGRANQSLAEYQRIRRWWVWPDADFPRTATGKPRAGIIRETVAAALAKGETRSRGAPADDRLGELIRKVHGGTGAVSTLGGPGDGSRIEFPRSRSSCSVPSRIASRWILMRRGLRARARSRKSNSFSARRIANRGSLNFRSGHGAGRSRGFAPRSTTCSHSPRRISWRTRASSVGEKLKGVRGPLLLVSNHQLYLDIGFLLAAAAPQITISRGRRHGRRTPGADAAPAPRMVFCEALGLSNQLFLDGRAVQRLPAAEAIRIPRELSLHGGARGSRLQHRHLSRRRDHARRHHSQFLRGRRTSREQFARARPANAN